MATDGLLMFTFEQFAPHCVAVSGWTERRGNCKLYL